MSQICRTCLSADRELMSVASLKINMKDITFLEMVDCNSGICWECRAIMKKFTAFKKQVIVANELFQESKPLQTLSSLRLSKIYLDEDYNHIIYTNPSDQTETIELKEIKHEKDLERKRVEKCQNNFDSTEISIKTNDLRLLTNTTKNINLGSERSSFHQPQSSIIPKSKCQNPNKISKYCRQNLDQSETEKHIIVSETQNTSLKIKLANKKSIKSNLFKRKARKPHYKDLNDKSSNFENRNLPVTDIKEKNTKMSQLDNLEKDCSFEIRNLPADVLRKKAEVKSLVHNKYETIFFSDEDLLRLRDKRRNNASYKKNPYKCDLCILGFMKEIKLKLHVKKKHDLSNPYTCPVCSARFRKSTSLETHKQKHYIQYKCKLCHHITSQHCYIISHCKKNHENDNVDRIHCKLCREVFNTQQDLNEHVKTNHSILCNDCGESFLKKNYLIKHIRRSHCPTRSYSCDACKKTFTTLARLENHMLTHSSNQRAPYCTLCRVQYKNLYNYRNHLVNSNNHATDIYQCDECKNKFASKNKLKVHINFYHLKKSKFKCEICSKIFVSGWKLKYHEQLYHTTNRKKDHVCSTCDKHFFTSVALKHHKLIHSEDRSFMCSECGDTFKQRPALYNHEKRLHKGVKKVTS